MAALDTSRASCESISNNSDIILDEEVNREVSTKSVEVDHDQASMPSSEPVIPKITSLSASVATDEPKEKRKIGEDESSLVCSEISLKLETGSVDKSSDPKSVQPTGLRPLNTRNRFIRDRALLDEMKFMADFDPKRSNRNRDKKRKRYTDGRPTVVADNFEDCDCLMKDCPGCHYPCRKCGDQRCGHECRQGRRWLYESIEMEGRGIELRNPRILQ